MSLLTVSTRSIDCTVSISAEASSGIDRQRPFVGWILMLLQSVNPISDVVVCVRCEGSGVEGSEEESEACKVCFDPP